jgi:hypothetical protein
LTLTPKEKPLGKLELVERLPNRTAGFFFLMTEAPSSRNHDESKMDRWTVAHGQLDVCLQPLGPKNNRQSTSQGMLSLFQ